VLAQPRQAIELLTALKNEQIHSAIETSGYGNPDAFKEIASLTDYLIYDLKHYDNEKHKQGTGVENNLIIQNLKYAHSIGKEILIRIAVIPGYNDSPEDAVGFASLIKSIGSIPVQLLPFHQFGQKKYEKLGLSYEYENYKSLEENSIAAFSQLMLECDITD